MPTVKVTELTQFSPNFFHSWSIWTPSLSSIVRYCLCWRQRPYFVTNGLEKRAFEFRRHFHSQHSLTCCFVSNEWYSDGCVVNWIFGNDAHDMHSMEGWLLINKMVCGHWALENFGNDSTAMTIQQQCHLFPGQPATESWLYIYLEGAAWVSCSRKDFTIPFEWVEWVSNSLVIGSCMCYMSSKLSRKCPVLQILTFYGMLVM